jgi:hypothetical protein
MEIEEKRVAVKYVGKGVIVDNKCKYVGGCSWQKNYIENVMAKCQLECL